MAYCPVGRYRADNGECSPYIDSAVAKQMKICLIMPLSESKLTVNDLEHIFEHVRVYKSFPETVTFPLNEERVSSFYYSVTGEEGSELVSDIIITFEVNIQSTGDLIVALDTLNSKALQPWTIYLNGRLVNIPVEYSRSCVISYLSLNVTEMVVESIPSFERMVYSDLTQAYTHVVNNSDYPGLRLTSLYFCQQVNLPAEHVKVIFEEEDFSIIYYTPLKKTFYRDEFVKFITNGVVGYRVCATDIGYEVADPNMAVAFSLSLLLWWLVAFVTTWRILITAKHR